MKQIRNSLEPMPLFQFQHKKLRYRIENNAFPEDVVFIHGNLGSIRWWQPTFDQLLKEQDDTMQGRLVAVDWLGCGDSSAPKSADELSITSLAQDHVEFIRAIGLTNVHLVGHSTGGLIALQAMLLAPELFAKVLLLDTVAAEGVKLAPEMLDAFKKMSVDRDFCEVVMASTVHGRDAKDPLVQGLIDDAFRVNKLVWTSIPEHLSRTDIRTQLKRVQQPALVLHGEVDQILPAEGAKDVAKLLPHAKFEMLKGRGHSTNVEDPPLFVSKLKEFFL